MKKLSYSAATFALLAAAPAAVYAQETAASLRGTVVDADGAPVSGATVTIVHAQSGTASTTTTGSTGAFFQSGLRVGGPYTITVSAPSFEGEALSDLYLRPGSQAPLSIALNPTTTDVIVVTGLAVNTLDLNNGVGSSYSASDIANQPATSRDVLRTLARDPLAIVGGGGSLSVAGSNPRFNGLAIDGSLQQDDFGLGSSTYATARSPINLDAIESASVAASDYSVTVGNFVGGLVNVVTRSGTNEFDGSAFYYRQDEDFIGNASNGAFVDQPPFTEEEYGVTLGGPIIEDRLFFFVSYDKFESGSSSNFTVSDAQNGVDPAFFTALADMVQTATGYDMGDRPLTVATPVLSERYLAKLDWNINDDHRLSFTYQQTEEGGTSNVSSNNFSTAWYDTPTELTAYTVQLFSDWTPNLSTTLRANFKDYMRGQDCRAGTDTPQLEFSLSAADVAGTPLDGLLNFGDANRDFTFVGGCDRFRHANEYDDSRLQLFASADYVWGDHVFTFGGEYESFELRNLFISDSSGRFRYFSVADIQSNSPNIQYQNIPSNDTAAGATSFTSDRYVLFAQDNWQINDVFSINYGFRYERFSMDDAPTADPLIEADYGITSTANLDGVDIFLPRIGFRWDALDRTTVSGGFGRFSGGNPWVWISNAFQQPVVFASGNFSNLTSLDVPQSLQDAVAAGTPGRVDMIDPNFELPSDWKASIRVDHEFDLVFSDLFDLGRDYRATFQYLYTNSDQTFGWQNMTQIGLASSLPVGVAPDGRPIYADLEDLGYSTGLTMLTNFDGGESHVFSVSLGKDYENGLGFQVGYAYQDVTAVTEGTSSRGVSNWRGIADVDPNNPSPRPSIFQVEDRFTVNLSYENEIFGNLETRFDVFGDIRSGSGFHYSFVEDRNYHLFGRSGSLEDPYSNSPLYVPTANDPLVVYGSGFDLDGFNQMVDSQGLARGRIQEAFGQQSGWNQQWDLRIQQELPGIWGAERFVGENRLKLVIDVQNFPNLLNDEWGTQTSGPSNGQLATVRASMVEASDVATNGVDGATALTGDDVRTTCASAGACVYRFENYTSRDETSDNLTSSVYRIRVGLRYEF